MSLDQKKHIPILTGKEHSTHPSGKTASLPELDKLFNDPTQPESKDVTAAKGLLKYAKSRPQSNLSDVVITHSITRSTHIALVMMPKWAVYFAPYNIARLSAVTKAAGYKTSIRDYNVETWHSLKNVLDEDPYEGHGSKDYLWLDEMYANKLKSHVDPLLEEYLEDLVSLKPDVVGFSLYYTNVIPSFWMAEQLKKRLPNVKIIGGGSHLQWHDENSGGRYPNFDHVIKGEAEELLLEMLDKIETGQPLTQYQYNSDFGRRINLDSLPFPDYSDMNIDRYLVPNAISSEISRGCVAKCAFCAETLFWKYRGRQGVRILDEVEQQYRTYGTNVFWFIDSLVNGNTNELRDFAVGVVDRGLRIRWRGYARCDDRMDFEYLKDLKKSGCFDLSFGIESGSQLVLDAMKKNTKIAVIERNLNDCKILGIECSTNWMLGFPGETADDFAKTITMAWRMQQKISGMARQAMNLGPSRIANDPEKYDIHPKHFLGFWATTDHSNTKLHRLIRVKSFNILVEQMPKYSTKNRINEFARNLNDTFNFDIEFKNQITVKDLPNYVDIPYEDFDYEIIKDPGLDSVFKRTVVNEIWPLFRTLWRSRKKSAMKMFVKFDPSWDYNNHGSALGGDDFTAVYNFEINDNQQWHASCRLKFNTPENPYLPWGIDSDTTDFSIDLDWSGSGQWD